MSLFFWGIALSLIYVGYDIYRNKKKLTNNVDEKVRSIWEDIKRENLKGWLIGFALFLIVLFTMRGFVMLEHQAQSCQIWDARNQGGFNIDLSTSGEGVIKEIQALSDNPKNIKGYNSFGLENGRSYGYYLKNIKLMYDGIKPEHMSIVCHWELKNLGKNVKLAWIERFK